MPRAYGNKGGDSLRTRKITRGGKDYYPEESEDTKSDPLAERRAKLLSRMVGKNSKKKLDKAIEERGTGGKVKAHRRSVKGKGNTGVKSHSRKKR